MSVWAERTCHMQTVREKKLHFIQWFEWYTCGTSIFKFGTHTRTCADKQTENEISNFSDCHASNNGQIAKWQSATSSSSSASLSSSSSSIAFKWLWIIWLWENATLKNWIATNLVSFSFTLLFAVWMKRDTRTIKSTLFHSFYTQMVRHSMPLQVKEWHCSPATIFGFV